MPKASDGRLPVTIELMKTATGASPGFGLGCQGHRSHVYVGVNSDASPRSKTGYLFDL